MSDQFSAVREKVINGEAEESVLLDATKQMADHSQALLEVANDDSQLETIADLLAEYDSKLGELLDLMGA